MELLGDGGQGEDAPDGGDAALAASPLLFLMLASFLGERLGRFLIDPLLVVIEAVVPVGLPRSKIASVTASPDSSLSSCGKRPNRTSETNKVANLLSPEDPCAGEWPTSWPWRSHLSTRPENACSNWLAPCTREKKARERERERERE